MHPAAAATAATSTAVSLCRSADRYGRKRDRECDA